MIRRFDTDTQMDEILALKPMPGFPQVYPRRTRYGEPAAVAMNLMPVEAYPDVLVPKDQWKERLAEAHKLKNLPKYYQYKTWAPPGFRYSQGSLGYCWTWGGCSTFMDVRAILGMPTVLVAPVSMGYLVGWANRGNYLESWIEGATQRGICPAINGNVNSHENKASVWTPFEEQRKLYRLAEGGVWDTNGGAGKEVMLQHCVSILLFGRPLYVAYNWWGHALSCPSILWDETQYLNVVVELRNSHDEDDIIQLTGSKAIPDEAYGFISMVAA